MQRRLPKSWSASTTCAEVQAYESLLQVERIGSAAYSMIVPELHVLFRI